MAVPIDPKPCKVCGKPSVDVRVEVDGSTSFLCEEHVGVLTEDARTPGDDRPQPPPARKEP